MNRAREARRDDHVVLDIQLDLATKGQIKRLLDRADARAVEISDTGPVQFGGVGCGPVKAEGDVTRDGHDTIDAAQVRLPDPACHGHPAKRRWCCRRLADNRKLKVRVLHRDTCTGVFQTYRATRAVIDKRAPGPGKQCGTTDRQRKNRRIRHFNAITVIDRFGLGADPEGTEQKHIVIKAGLDCTFHAKVQIGCNAIDYIRDRVCIKDGCIRGIKGCPVQLDRCAGRIGRDGRIQADFQIVGLEVDAGEPANIQLCGPGPKRGPVLRCPLNGRIRLPLTDRQQVEVQVLTSKSGTARSNTVNNPVCFGKAAADPGKDIARIHRETHDIGVLASSDIAGQGI